MGLTSNCCDLKVQENVKLSHVLILRWAADIFPSKENEILEIQMTRYFLFHMLKKLFLCSFGFPIIFSSSSFLFFLAFFVFLGPYPRHIKVSRPGAELELQLPAYATATATWDPSRIHTAARSSARSLTH